jgi:hypothetical protein
MNRLVIGLAAIFLISCEKKVSKNPPNIKTHRQSSDAYRSDQKQSAYAIQEGVSGSTKSSRFNEFSQGLKDLSVEEIANIARTIINGSRLSPESEDAEKLQLLLSHLLRRDINQFSELIGMLPPGYYSDKIVSNVFWRADFKTFGEVVQSAQWIKEADFYKSALDGSVNQFIQRAISGNSRVGIGIDQLEQLKKAGLSANSYSDLVLAGINTGEFDIVMAAQHLNLEDNVVMSRAVRFLPRDQAIFLLGEAYSKNFDIAPHVISEMARSYVTDDPKGAFAWAARLPSNDGIIATRSAFSEWMAADPMAASRYLGGMEAGQLKDTAIFQLVKNSSKNGVASEASAWIPEMSDDSLRKEAQKLIDNSK